jgi:hypothetical protein
MAGPTTAFPCRSPDLVRKRGQESMSARGWKWLAGS